MHDKWRCTNRGPIGDKGLRRLAKKLYRYCKWHNVAHADITVVNDDDGTDYINIVKTEDEGIKSEWIIKHR